MPKLVSPQKKKRFLGKGYSFLIINDRPYPTECVRHNKEIHVGQDHCSNRWSDNWQPVSFPTDVLLVVSFWRFFANRRGTDVPLHVKQAKVEVHNNNNNVTKKEAEKILKYKEINNRNTAHVECKNKSDASNKRGSWNHLKIIQKIPDQHTGKARNQGATQNSHTGHCADTPGSTNAPLPKKKFIRGNNSICATICNHRIAVTLCNLQIWSHVINNNNNNNNEFSYNAEACPPINTDLEYKTAPLLPILGTAMM